MIDGYFIDDCGVIRQSNPKPFAYDEAYIAKQQHGEVGKRMAKIRAAFVGTTVSVCDIGFGAGDFLREMVAQNYPVCFGYDVAPPVQIDRVTMLGSLDQINAHTITMFDSLEHMPSLEWLSTVKAGHLVVTVPWCHAKVAGDAWFEAWKHRKPDEHLWHFDLDSLIHTMRKYGWTYYKHGSPEDEIRGKLPCGRDNTLTAAFIRQDEDGSIRYFRRHA